MSATRTQIYLTEEQRQAIDAVCSRDQVTMAEVIRRALDAYLASPAEAESALGLTFGALPGIEAPSRAEWQRG